MCADVVCTPFVFDAPLTHEVVRDGRRLLLQCRARVACVGEDRLIVPVDVRGFVDSDSNHPEFVSKALDIVAGCLHSNELAAKGARLARCLTLLVPKYWRGVEEDNKASARASSQRVSSMTTISTYTCMHMDFPSGLGMSMGSSSVRPSQPYTE